MNIVSVPGRLVRDPVTRRVIDDTPIAIDPTDPTWSRLLADGDVVEAPAVETSAEKAAPSSKDLTA